MGRFWSLMILFVFCFSFVQAEEWKSPDGLFSFTVPDGFEVTTEIPTNENEIQHWTDNISYTLSVVKTSVSLPSQVHTNPQRFIDSHTKRCVNSAIPLCVENFGVSPSDVKVFHSGSGKTKEGFAFFDVTLSATNANENTTFFVRQYTVCIGYKVAYSLGFWTINDNPKDVTVINDSIATIKIHAIPSMFSSKDNKKPTNPFVEYMVQFAIACVLIAFCLFFIRKRYQAQQASNADMPIEN